MEFVPGTEIEKPVVTPADGNVFSVMGAVRKGLRRAGVSEEIISEYCDFVRGSGSYDRALQISMEYAELMPS